MITTKRTIELSAEDILEINRNLEVTRAWIAYISDKYNCPRCFAGEKDVCTLVYRAQKRCAKIYSRLQRALNQEQEPTPKNAAEKQFVTGRFYAWHDPHKPETSVCFSFDGDWFLSAINCMRDGDMGAKGPDGVYERIWATDSIDTKDKRYATPEEVKLYIKHAGVPLDDPDLYFIALNQTPEYTEAIFERRSNQDNN